MNKEDAYELPIIVFMQKIKVLSFSVYSAKSNTSVIKISSKQNAIQKQIKPTFTVINSKSLNKTNQFHILSNILENLPNKKQNIL